MISGFRRHIAVSALAGLPLVASNRRLADYWLTLWEGDALPSRDRFSPAAVRDLLPGLMIQEIKPGVSMTVRLSGTAINAAFGRDLTGCDLIALSPPETRAARLERNSRIAEGAIGLALRRRKTRLGFNAESEELHLPFRDVSADGARQILLHTSWRPKNVTPGQAEIVNLLRLADEFRIIPLRPEVDGACG